MKKLWFLVILLNINFGNLLAQNNTFLDSLMSSYETYKETSLNTRRFKHADIVPLIEKLKMEDGFTVKAVGTSILGKEIHLISLGQGDIDVFLWSQMHGDEPTATQAIFDILNFFKSSDYEQFKQSILQNTTLHFMPMVNPDGAENFVRRNALSIDINRDALRLQSPEAQSLKGVRDSLEADFGFNLHDQSIYYNAQGTSKPATISFLAPAYNFEKDINEVRIKSMQLIAHMNKNLQYLAEGQVARYNDDFEPRAFGDNFQKWGTSTILIESGGFKNDVEKQYIRKLNFVAIISALSAIANKSYSANDIVEYESIPENDRKLFDLKIEGVSYELVGKDYIVDLGINHTENEIRGTSEFYNVGAIMDIGDLSTSYGYHNLNAAGYKLIEGNVYDKIYNSLSEISEETAIKLLSQGFTFVRVKNLSKSQEFTDLPIQVLGVNRKKPKFDLNFGRNPTFVLEKEGKIDYAVINGFLIDLSKGHDNFNNALIFD